MWSISMRTKYLIINYKQLPPNLGLSPILFAAHHLSFGRISLSSFPMGSWSAHLQFVVRTPIPISLKINMRSLRESRFSPLAWDQTCYWRQSGLLIAIFWTSFRGFCGSLMASLHYPARDYREAQGSYR